MTTWCDTISSSDEKDGSETKDKGNLILAHKKNNGISMVGSSAPTLGPWDLTSIIDFSFLKSIYKERNGEEEEDYAIILWSVLV